MVWIRAKKKAKFGNRQDGKYDSRKEKRRADELGMMRRAGLIEDLKEQVRFELIPKQYVDGKLAERATHYVADFTYMENGKLVVEDVKSEATRKLPVYVIKRKLMLHVHGVRIRET